MWRPQLVADVSGHTYVLEADVLAWEERCHLYRDGELADSQPSPASFPLDEQLTLEARIGWCGLRRAHLMGPSGASPLRPLDGTWEHARQQFERRRPGLSVLLAVASWLVLAGVLVVEGLQSVQWVTRKAWFDALSSWDFLAPVSLPLTANIALTLLGLAALLERVLRLRHRWLG